MSAKPTKTANRAELVAEECEVIPVHSLGEHGTLKRYRQDCKCKLCRAANAKRTREQRQA